MSVHYRFDQDRVIPIPFGLSETGTVERWAADAAAGYARRLDLDDLVRQRLVGLLSDVAGHTLDGRGAALIFLPEPGIAAPLNVFSFSEQLDATQQSEFLRPRDSRLRSRPEFVSAESLGRGVTCATIERRGDIDFGVRRWLFTGLGRTVGVTLGPVIPYGLAFVEAVAVEVVRTLSVSDFTADPAHTSASVLHGAIAPVWEEWVR